GFRGRGGGGQGARRRARLAVPAALNRAGAGAVRGCAGRPPRELDVAPVRAGAELLGFLVAAVPDEVLDEDGRRRALEHGSTVLALELSKERAAAEVERRLRGDLVEELLAGGLDDAEAERLARQAERLAPAAEPGLG